MNDAATHPKQKPILTRQDRIQILFEEYRSLYDLLRFRLEAMDQRLPLAGGALITALGTLSSMSPETKHVLLLTLPAAIVWLGRMTFAHARSKEDLKRRIDELERQINGIAGEELLAFQSRHPGAIGNVGGRTGTGTVWAVLTLCLTMLGACGYLFAATRSSRVAILSYSGYVAGLALHLVIQVPSLRRYEYRKVQL